MKFEYSATNIIPMNSPKQTDDYISLCWRYITSHFSKLDCYNSVPAEYGELMYQDRERMMLSYNNPEHPKPEEFKEPMGDVLEQNFNLTTYGHIGFLVNITFDKKAGGFKLRLFEDETLKKRNLDVLSEPMRGVYLASGPAGLGMEVRKKMESGIEPVTSALTWEDTKNQYKKRIEHETKYFEEEGRDFTVKLLEVEKKHLEANGCIDLLKHNAGLFRDMRNEFSFKLPDAAEELKGTAFGSFPMNYLQDAVGMTAPAESFLPVERGMVDDRRLSLVNAEIIERPLTDCRHIISFYPYTSPIGEINGLHESFLKDDDIIRGVIAHEFAEIGMRKIFEPVFYNDFKMMLDSSYRRETNERHAEQDRQIHQEIDRLLVKMGLARETKKFYKAYIDTAENLLAQKEARERQYIEPIKEACERSIKFMETL